jgi:hypothetical protein
MAVKVPPLLHKMSMAAQKAWYKKHGMEMPKAETGRSAAQAKKDVGEINKKKARQAAIAAAAAASKKNKELVSSSERVRQMAQRRREGGEGLGGGLETNRDIISYVRAGGTIKAGRLGEENIQEGNPATKEKLKNYVRGLGVKATIKGLVPFDQRHSPLRSGRKVLQTKTTAQLKQEEVQLDEVTKQEAEKALGGPVKTRTGSEPKGKLPLGFRSARNLARKAMKKGGPVNETGEYTIIGHAPEHSIDVDPTPADALKPMKRKKPVQYKSGMRNGAVKESIEEEKMNRGKVLAKAIMKKQSTHPIAQTFGEEIVNEEPKDAADAGEYDYEGDMAKSQLRSILTHAKRLHDMLEDQSNLPEWVQSKITLAQDYILTAADYMEGEMNEEKKGTASYPLLKAGEKLKPMKLKVAEEVEQIDELKKSTLASYVNKAANQVRAKTGIAASFETQGTRKRDPENKAAYMGLAKDFRQGAKKRLTGIEKATVKLAKEEAEQVTEAEGKVAVTPKEKELAAHHGDKSRITFGDVLKARLKSAAEKAMKKGN